MIHDQGVSGAGKSTLGRALAEVAGVPFMDGDDLHPRANIDKMASGQELTDDDRKPWLKLIRVTAENMLSEQHAPGLVVACSALKKEYRDMLRGVPQSHAVPGPHRGSPFATYFVYIKEDKDTLRDRMEKRPGHFMKADMLDSQINTLESPEGEDNVVTVPLNVSTEEQVRIALAWWLS